MIKSNFHTHTTYCDGKDTPREMIEAAIALGLEAIGFSGHSYLPDEKSPYYMTPDKYENYKREILALKEEYKGRIDVYLGLEEDMDSPITEDGALDYKIGSLHGLYLDGKYYAIDSSRKDTERIVNEFFGGDFDSFSEKYFDRVKDVISKTGADIIGHIDLVAKYKGAHTSYETPRYLAAASAAVKHLCTFGVPFEINTGAMARGCRCEPYPSPSILAMIKKYGGKIAISSDCHDSRYLNFAFEEAESLAKGAGFTEYAVIGRCGIEYKEF